MKPRSTKQFQASVRGALLVVILTAILFFTVQPVPVSAAGCPNGRRCAYIPLVKSPANGGDLIVQNIEVVQAVQDANNSVPLVAGRNTMLRIYARTGGSSSPMKNVKISVTANDGSHMLNESPRSYTATIPLEYNRANIQSSINITLPISWVSGSVSFTVRLDPDNSIGEPSESNNIITKSFTFQQVDPLRVKIVPIKYVNTKDGHTYPAPTNDTIKDWILRTYPVPDVEISWRSAYTFTGDLTKSTEFQRLLSEVTSLKTSENAPSAQVYYALVPITGGGNNWFYGGVAGIGWIGSRVAVGLDTSGSSGQIAAHEIGHNLGLEHSPCGVTVPKGSEYPYPDGTIGQIGIDTFSGVLYPPTSKDVMSYCTPKWVSDYTYRSMFNVQRAQSASDAQAASNPAQRGLFVRAEISEAGVALQPAYVVPGSFASLPEAGEYLLETLDAEGNVLSQTALRAYTAETEEGEQGTAINVMVPLNDQPAASFRLVKDGQVVASQSLIAAEAQTQLAGESAPDAAALTLNTPEALNSALAQIDLPALVRYSTDGGASWTTLSMDATAGTALELPVESAVYQVLVSGTWY